ncbi:hypothetical protein K2X30_14025 [bacterium]|nr:hypothetical protein [bacterium]
MKRLLFGELHCHHMPCKAELRNEVENQISDWVEGHIFDEYPKAVVYDVDLEFIGRDCLVGCQICIHWNHKTWRGYWTGRNFEQAIGESLDHMRKSGGKVAPLQNYEYLLVAGNFLGYFGLRKTVEDKSG